MNHFQIQVEYQDGNKNIEINGDMKQTVYIFRCVNSTIQVKGKGFGQAHISQFSLFESLFFIL